MQQTQRMGMHTSTRMSRGIQKKKKKKKIAMRIVKEIVMTKTMKSLH